MPKRLTAAQIESYRKHGFCFPVPVLSADETAACRADLERYERQIGRPLDFPEKSKPHLLFVVVIYVNTVQLFLARVTTGAPLILS